MVQATWAKMVKDRDHWKCRVCGSTERLCAHHIQPKRKASALVFDVDNGITLCYKHHRLAHHGNFGNRREVRCAILSNRDWFTADAMAEVDAVIQRAIYQTMKKDRGE